MASGVIGLAARCQLFFAGGRSSEAELPWRGMGSSRGACSGVAGGDGELDGQEGGLGRLGLELAGEGQCEEGGAAAGCQLSCTTTMDKLSAARSARQPRSARRSTALAAARGLLALITSLPTCMHSKAERGFCKVDGRQSQQASIKLHACAA